VERPALQLQLQQLPFLRCLHGAAEQPRYDDDEAVSHSPV
jgi:hypothetical protein